MNKILTVLKSYVSFLMFAVPIVGGALLLLLAGKMRAQPEKHSERELARTLRVIDARPTAVVPRAFGFGESAPSKSFQAVAEVKGKIVQLHPDLKSGSFIRKDELLVAIDTTDVEISIQKLQAEIARSEASVAELNATQKNLETGLAIEQSSLELAKRDLERREKLQEQNAVSASEVDDQRRSVLAQQQSVQNLQNSLNLLPAQIQSAEASIAVSQANLASSQRDLQRCRIVAPFNCRLGQVELELSEVVSVGQQLLTAQAIDKLEIEAQFGLDKIAGLLQRDGESPDIVGDLNADPQQLVRKFFDVDVVVRYGAGGAQASRQAKFERLREQLDSQSRTVGIVVSIDKPFQQEGNAVEAGPPPVPGTYCEVELSGKPILNAFLIPRSAIRGDAVFLVDEENRLRTRTVTVLLRQQNYAVIRGLETGDRVVVSDPAPAINGMLVDPQPDQELMRMLQAETLRAETLQVDMLQTESQQTDVGGKE